MIKDLLLVGIGSGIGGICRYLISVLMGYAHNGFPWGTFVANISGCLLIGILWGVTSRYHNISQAFTLLLMVGFVVVLPHSPLSQKKDWLCCRAIITYFSSYMH